MSTMNIIEEMKPKPCWKTRSAFKLQNINFIGVEPQQLIIQMSRKCVINFSLDLVVFFTHISYKNIL